MIIPKLCLLAFIISSAIGQDTAYLTIMTGDSIQRFQMVKSEDDIYRYDGTIDSGHKLYQNGLEFIKIGSKFNIKQTHANDALSLEIEINEVTIKNGKLKMEQLIQLLIDAILLLRRISNMMNHLRSAD